MVASEDGRRIYYGDRVIYVKITRTFGRTRARPASWLIYDHASKHKKIQ